MHNHPPHLPPKTCSIPFHRYMGTIKVAVLSVIIGVMAGGASALAVIAWVPSLFPQLDPTTLTAHITQAAAAGRGVELAPELWTKTRAAHVFIFAKTTQPQEP